MKNKNEDINNKQFEFREEYWDEARLLLQKEKKKRRAIIWWNLFGASILTLGVVYAIAFSETQNEASAFVAHNNEINQQVSNRNQVITENEIDASKNKSKNVLEHQLESKDIKTLKGVERANNSLKNAKSNKINDVKIAVVNDKSAAKEESKELIRDFTVNDSELRTWSEDSKLNDVSISTVSMMVKPTMYVFSDIVGKIISNPLESARINKFGLEVIAGVNQVKDGKRGMDCRIDLNYKLGNNFKAGIGLGLSYYNALYKQRFDKLVYDELKNNLYQVNGNGTLPPGILLGGAGTYVVGGVFYSGNTMVEYRQTVDITNLYSINLVAPVFIEYSTNRHSFKVNAGVECMIANRVKYQEKNFVLGEELTSVEANYYNSFRDVHRTNAMGEVSYSYALNERLKIQASAKMIMNYKIHNPVCLGASLRYRIF